MNAQELETAVRLGLSFVTVIFNDGGYGLIGWKQQTQFGRRRLSGSATRTLFATPRVLALTDIA